MTERKFDPDRRILRHFEHSLSFLMPSRTCIVTATVPTSCVTAVKPTSAISSAPTLSGKPTDPFY